MDQKFLIIVYCLFISVALQAQSLSFENVSIEVNTNNALRLVAKVSTSEPAFVYVRYVYTDKGEAYEEISPLSNFEQEHELNLIGFRDSTLYQLRVFAFNKNNQIQSQIFEHTTASLPLMIQNFRAPTVNSLNNRQTYSITNTMRGSESFYFICDTEGRLVWYKDYNVLHNVCNGWRWTKENTILQADCRTIRETDLFGNIINNIEIENAEWNLHHDVMKLRDGNIMSIYTKPEMARLSQTIDTTKATVAVDGFLILNTAGEILTNWSTSDHFDISKAERKGAYWNFIYGTGTVDWCHFNALEEDLDGSILISVSHWSRILKVNRATGELIWQLGDGGNVNANFSFKHQHAITYLAPNRYLMFDNFGLDGSSRVIEFAIELQDNRAFTFWEYVPEPGIVSLTRGNSQRLDNGNTLAYFPTSRGIIQEVNTEGELLWQVETNRSGYRAYRIPHLNPPHPLVIFKIEATQREVCINDAPFNVFTQPENAYISGEGIEDGQFNPQKAGVGISTITALYGTSVHQIEIEVLALPEATIKETDDQLLEIEEELKSYQWFLNDTIIDGANENTHQALSSGLYYAQVTNEFDCTAYSDTINFIYVDVPQVEKTPVQFISFPEYLLVQNSINYPLFVEVFSIDGRQLFKASGESVYQISTKQFPSLYLLRYSDGKEFKVNKMLKY